MGGWGNVVAWSFYMSMTPPFFHNPIWILEIWKIMMVRAEHPPNLKK